MLLFKIAARLGKTVSELEHELDYAEYLKWAEFFECEYRTYEKADYYMAQIAQCCLIPHSTKLPELKDFLVKFETKEEKAEKIPVNLFCKILKAAFGIGDKK